MSSTMMMYLVGDSDSSTMRKARRRRRRRELLWGHQLPGHPAALAVASWPAFLIGIACLCWVLLIISNQSALDKYLSQVEGTSVKFWRRFRHKQLRKQLILATRPPIIYENPKYIMFLPIESGQGMGNIMNGLLAAHLFGEEFGRVVCVSTQFADFHRAFSPLHPQAIRDCPGLPQINPVEEQQIQLFNYYSPPNECELRDTLASPNHKVLYLIGNTYPRWPPVPDNFFVQYYRPKSALLELLPWTHPPHTVVHLRQPDSVLDPRKGLDPYSLLVLGKTLPGDKTFLVTNKVEWYDYFAQEFGWAHPSWQEVKHSALGLTWGSRRGSETNRKQQHETRELRHAQTLQLWCDWYTILMAKRVYHTHSDFSLSAIHWMNIADAKTIQGVNETQETLILTEESWRIDGECLPLANRSQDQLQLCSKEQRELQVYNDVGRLMRLREMRMARAHGGMRRTSESEEVGCPLHDIMEEVTLPDGTVQRKWRCPDQLAHVIATM